MTGSDLPQGVPFEQARSFLMRVQQDLRILIFKEIRREGGMSHQRVFMYGIAKRTFANAHAFMAMQDAMNANVAAALVRLQLDTLLRLYALWWVEDADSFAEQIWAGAQINKLKAADGSRMTDSYLAERLGQETPWIPTVYKETSGFIHFSNRHMKMALMDHGDGGSDTSLNLEALDVDRDPIYFKEIASSFTHITMAIDMALKFRFAEVGMLPDDQGLGMQISRLAHDQTPADG